MKFVTSRTFANPEKVARGNYFHRQESNSSMALNKISIWTEEEDHRLLELRQSGRSSVSIAARLKRTAGFADVTRFETSDQIK